MGAVQPELFYIPWKHKGHGDSVYIRIVNSETLQYEYINKIRIELQSTNSYIYDYEVTEQYERSYYTPNYQMNISDYREYQRIIALPEDDPQKVMYEYGYGVMSYDSDKWVQFPWDYKEDFVRREDWALASQYWENPETSPYSYVWVENSNTPKINGGTFTLLKENECEITFSSRDIVEIQNMPRGIWCITAYVDFSAESCWTLAQNTNGTLYAPNSAYWRDIYMDMSFYDNWVEPYDTSDPKQYTDAHEYYYADQPESYQPTGGYYHSPYNVIKNTDAPEHYPYYWQYPDGTYNTDLEDTDGNIPSVWTTPHSAYAVNISRNHKVSLFASDTGVTWIDPRWDEYLHGKTTTPMFNYFRGASHPLANNTIYYLVNGAQFNCTCNVYQQYKYGMTEYITPTQFDLHNYAWAGSADLYYEGGCIFEVTYEDGSTSTAGVVSSYDRCYASLSLKRGRNIIKCISAPYYSGYTQTNNNSPLRLHAPEIADMSYYQNDTHTEVVNITREDLIAMQQGTYVIPVFNFYFAIKSQITIKIVRKGLPQGVVVVTDGGISTYDYCYAMEFYHNGTYCGYLQAGIAPYGVGLTTMYGMNYFDKGNENTHYMITLIYKGQDMDEPPIDISELELASGFPTTISHDSSGNARNGSLFLAVNDDKYVYIYDMDEPNRDKLVVFAQFGQISETTDDYESHWHHLANVLKCGRIALYHNTQNHADSNHINNCSFMPRYSATSWGRMIGNLLEDCNCLNETNGICGNPTNQQYYYLGDGLTKQQAREFIGCLAFRSNSVTIEYEDEN